MGQSPLKAVLFDLWGTLIIDDPASSELRRVFRIETAQAALADLGFMYEFADIEAAFLAAGTELAALHAAEADMSARGRTIAYLRQVDELLPDRLPGDAWSRMDEVILTPAIHHPPVIMPAAVETLAEVKALGLPVALVSNAGVTPGFVLRRILDNFDLLTHMDVTVFSDEVEMAKPNPAIFRHALDELGLEPAEAAFVGDQPILDVFGARRAGLWTIQIGSLPPDGADPHARIDALTELVPALRRLDLL